MRTILLYLCILLLGLVPAFGQASPPASEPASQGQASAAADDAPAATPAADDRLETPIVPGGFRVEAAAPRKSLEKFQWRKALEQSLKFLAIEHSLRLTQPKTRAELGGPWFNGWFSAAGRVHGWGDGDGIFTNYFGHPMQGAGAGFIEIQNDPAGRNLEFGDPGYWPSRMRAMAWAALYSTQFELGPVSEASIGHVGKEWGTAGYVDLVMTPVGGMLMIVGEDAADRYWVKPLESRTRNLALRRFYRIAFNPARSFANVMRGKVPWHRDTRPLRDAVARPDTMAPGPAGDRPTSSSRGDARRE